MSVEKQLNRPAAHAAAGSLCTSARASEEKNSEQLKRGQDASLFFVNISPSPRLVRSGETWSYFKLSVYRDI